MREDGYRTFSTSFDFSFARANKNNCNSYKPDTHSLLADAPSPALHALLLAGPSTAPPAVGNPAKSFSIFNLNLGIDYRNANGHQYKLSLLH